MSGQHSEAMVAAFLADHAKAADMIRKLYASQVRNAFELGRHAGQFGTRSGACPFSISEAILRHEWRRGYDEGESLNTQQGDASHA